MKIVWLRCFLALEKFKSFSLAADSLFMTQSNLSKQLKSLEEELNCQLFDRATRDIKLTQAGEKIYLNAQWMVGEYDRMLHGLAELNSMSKSKISISVPYDMSHYDIADMIISFENMHQGLVAETHESDTEKMFFALDNHITDFGIGYMEFWQRKENYIIYPLYSDDIVLVMSKNHPLASVRDFSLGMARDCLFCLPREEGGFFRLFLDMCNEANFPPRLTLSDVRISTIRRYVGYGMRITMTSKLRADHYFADEFFLKIPVAGVSKVTLSIAVRNEKLNSLQKEFILHAQSWYRDLASSDYAPRKT